MEDVIPASPSSAVAGQGRATLRRSSPSVLVRFTDGIVGVLVESFIMKSLKTVSGQEVHTLRIDGDLGNLTTSDGQTIRVFSEHEDYLPGGQLREHLIHVPANNSFQAQIAHFLESIRTGTKPLTSGNSQRRALAPFRSLVHSQRPWCTASILLPSGS